MTWSTKHLAALPRQIRMKNINVLLVFLPDRRRRLDTLQTGDGRLLPDHLKAQVCRELDRLELLLEQIRAVEAERDVLLAAQQVAAPAPAAMLLDIKGIGPEFAAISILQHGRKHRLNVAGRAADNLEHLRSCRLLLPRLVQLAGAQIQLFLQIASGTAVTAHGLWRSAAL
jgi:transposase